MSFNGNQAGIVRFGKSATYHKKAIFKFRKAKGVVKKAADKKPQFVEKKIGGDKNGGTRGWCTPVHHKNPPRFSSSYLVTR